MGWIVLTLTVLCILLILAVVMQYLQLKNAQAFMDLYWKRMHQTPQQPQVIMSEVIEEEEPYTQPLDLHDYGVVTTVNGLQVGPDGVTYAEEPRRTLWQRLRGD